MNYDVTQWLAEIKSLQKQLTEIYAERDSALKSAANWRQLYETEAKQRRAEMRSHQQAVAALNMDLAALQGAPAGEGQTAAIAAAVAGMTAAELQQALIQTQQERDQLRQALQAEQAAHGQTRHSLTAALSDAVDQLTRIRQEMAARSPAGVPAAPTPTTPTPTETGDRDAGSA